MPLQSKRAVCPMPPDEDADFCPWEPGRLTHESRGASGQDRVTGESFPSEQVPGYSIQDPHATHIRMSFNSDKE